MVGTGELWARRLRFEEVAPACRPPPALSASTGPAPAPTWPRRGVRWRDCRPKPRQRRVELSDALAARLHWLAAALRPAIMPTLAFWLGWSVLRWQLPLAHGLVLAAQLWLAYSAAACVLRWRWWPLAVPVATLAGLCWAVVGARHPPCTVGLPGGAAASLHPASALRYSCICRCAGGAGARSARCSCAWPRPSSKSRWRTSPARSAWPSFASCRRRSSRTSSSMRWPACNS